jgi:hypothetical protein
MTPSFPICAVTFVDPKRTLSALALALALAVAPQSTAAKGPATIDVFGLTHVPLGQATLTLDPNGYLIVSNIGSSGRDGVLVELGDAPRGMRTQFDAVRPATSLPIGAVYRFVLEGDGSDRTSLTMTRTGTELAVQPDFTPFGGESYEIQVTLTDGSRLTFPGGALSVEATPIALAAAWEGTPCTSHAPLRYDLAWPTPVVVTVSQQVYLATRITIASLDDFTATVGTARTEVAMEELVIAHEGLELDSNTHGGLAGVNFRPLADRLVVERLPADGSGGIRIQPAIGSGATSGVHRTATRWLPIPLEPGFDPPQAALRLRVFGPNDETLLAASVVGELQRLDVLEAPGASSLRVQVLDAGLLVADEVVPLGAVAELGDWPVAAVVHQETPASHAVVQWKLLSARPMKILRPDLVVTGTELRIQPVGGSPPPGGAQGSDLLVGGTPQLEVVPWSSGAMPSVSLLGLAHRGVGLAEIVRSPGELILGNIGCSAGDGVEVETGPVDGFTFDLQGVQLPIDASLGLRAVDSDCVVAGLEMTGATSGVMFRPDGAPLRATVQIRLSDGELIGYVYEGAPVSSSTPPDRIGCAVDAPDEVAFRAEWDAPQTLAVPGMGTVTATRVDHVLLLAAPAAPTTWRLLASDTPSFAVSRETLDRFGQGFSALGQAQMSSVVDRLVVGNIGASGDDGLDVRPGFDPQDQIRVHVEDLEPSFPLGSSLTFQEVGTASLPPYENIEIVFHTVTFSNLAPGDIMLLDDYALLGASGHRVSLWDRKHLVAESTGLGSVASFAQMPTSFAEELTPEGPVYLASWDELTEVTLAGASKGVGEMKFFARTLRLEPLDPTVSLEWLDAMRIQATGLTSLALTEAVSVTATAPELPTARGVVLHPNAPNPFNPRTRISYTLERAGWVSLGIFDLRGRLVRHLWRGNRPEGTGSVQWDGTDAANQRVASGVYVVRVELEGTARERKITLVK